MCAPALLSSGEAEWTEYFSVRQKVLKIAAGCYSKKRWRRFFPTFYLVVKGFALWCIRRRAIILGEHCFKVKMKCFKSLQQCMDQWAELSYNMGKTLFQFGKCTVSLGLLNVCTDFLFLTGDTPSCGICSVNLVESDKSSCKELEMGWYSGLCTYTHPTIISAQLAASSCSASKTWQICWTREAKCWKSSSGHLHPPPKWLALRLV